MLEPGQKVYFDDGSTLLELVTVVGVVDAPTPKEIAKPISLDNFSYRDRKVAIKHQPDGPVEIVPFDTLRFG